MSEHGYGIRISESYVDPNPWKVERQDPDNFNCFQTRKMCAWEIAAYVFKWVFFWKVHFLNTVEAKVIILTWYVKPKETLAMNKFQRSRLTFIFTAKVAHIGVQ